MRAAGVVVLVLVSTTASAAPEDDHKRGLLAYHRGDVATAISALRPAATAGHAPSQSLLAFFYERAGDVDAAAKLYRDAAAQGHVDGHVGLAELLLAGRGVAKDEKAAFGHFSKAAALGHRHAAEVVATAWLKSQWSADEQADPAAARAAVQRAAELGHLPSAEALALAWKSGRFGLPLDETQAARWQAQISAWRQQRSAAASAPTLKR